MEKCRYHHNQQNVRSRPEIAENASLRQYRRPSEPSSCPEENEILQEHCNLGKPPRSIEARSTYLQGLG